MNIFLAVFCFLLAAVSCERHRNANVVGNYGVVYDNYDSDVKNYKKNYSGLENNINEFSYRRNNFRQFIENNLINTASESDMEENVLQWDNYKKWFLVSFYKWVLIAYNPWLFSNYYGRSFNRNVNDKKSVQEINYSEKDSFACFPQIGCFAMGKPWKSKWRPVKEPFSPEKMETTLFFFSRENLNEQVNIILYPKIIMNDAKFNPNKPTAIIVHGFSSSGNAPWMLDLKDVYLKRKDANVMLVNWEKGSNLINYLQAAGNIRVVGKQLGIFVNYLIKDHNADPKKFHLIGHSLGAHICSYLAKDVPGIGRLTALDPAQPAFEGFDKLVRLDSSDAEFVEVIHTDAKPFPLSGFGMMAPYGHVDFYMNGGFEQPGCVPLPKNELPPVKNLLDLAKFPVELIAKTVICPHSRAYQFLIEAYNETEKCTFRGRRATYKNMAKSVFNLFFQGVLGKIFYFSRNRNTNDGIPLGFETISSPLRGSFIVTTKRDPPFCM